MVRWKDTTTEDKGGQQVYLHRRVMGGVETAAKNETLLNQITVNKTKEAKVKTKHQDYKLSK